jgi:hypothetical protein
MIPDVPSWLTETSLSSYPLLRSFGYDGFIVDAQFIQYDSFRPLLNYIQVIDNTVRISITFDQYPLIFTVSYADLTNPAFILRMLHNDRYLGKLIFGYAHGVDKLFNAVGNNTTIKVGQRFLANTVKSIPSKCGVYAINGLYGDIAVNSDQNINYQTTDLSGNAHNIVFNAVAVPSALSTLYLKTLNNTAPVNNSVFIKNSEIVKVVGQGSTVVVSLVGTAPSDLIKANSIIVTSG